ncbi:ABC transporter permease [Hoeflea sp.]|uniref:ABC transporter permease n=1 Tax=Hoeflea sp. TaxID=1940281 RepID=UPI00198415B4|nr:ABC transporter permease [Hoeflea sp.]MBC7284270.1 ABC transporter permease [Hoeflea sp.]
MLRLSYIPLLQFLIRYRRTALGPLWLLIGPSLFIALLGGLYAEIGAAEAQAFVPHLAVGIVLWTLFQSFVTGSATVFQRGKAQIMQGAQTTGDIVAVDVISTLLAFLHQVPIVIAVFIIYRVPLSWTSLESLLGLGLILANGYWVTYVFGIFGARYRDLSEIFQALMRIAFLATPIIWMPGAGGRGSVMDAFLAFNPFYHFVETVRAPLLGNEVSTLSWIVVVSITVIGFGVARITTERYSRLVPLWI